MVSYLTKTAPFSVSFLWKPNHSCQDSESSEENVTKSMVSNNQVSLHFLIDAIIFPVMTQLKLCISSVYIYIYEYGIDLKINSDWTSWETAKRF